MTDMNYGYTKDQMAKHLVALEDHMKSNPCPDCVNKHLLAIEGLGEEGSTMVQNPEDRLEWLGIADMARNARKKLTKTV
jgi:hypothetical protein